MMADVHGDPRDAPQMPQATSPGSAPVPGPGGQRPEPPMYSVTDFGPQVDHPLDIVHAVPAGNAVQQNRDAYAIDASAGGVCATADAPYSPGPLHPIPAHGDDDPGGRSDVAGDVAQAVANAQARWQNLMGDLGTTGTPGPGAQPVHAGQVGDLMQFPSGDLDPGAGVGNTIPTGAFYDPNREYGGPGGAPGYGGEQGLPAPGQQGKPQ